MTELQITLYSGVPFNNKYKDVLFVSRETRETFLNNYSIVDNFTVNRFEIINDNETVVDITNDYNGFECNYAKVHTKLQPETSNEIYERDTFYFVNSARQIGTNVVRLTLEKDVFQTDFNKYNYNISDYQIPQIKNGRCILTNDEQDDFANIKNKSILTAMKEYNKKITFTPLFTQSATQNICYIVFEFTLNNGLNTFCGITDKPCFVLGGAVHLPSTYYLYRDIMLGLQSSHIYIADNQTNMEILHTYLIPQSMIDTTLFANLKNAELRGGNSATNVGVKYGSFEGQLATNYGHYYKDTKTITVTPEKDKMTLVGTLQNQIELPYNSQNYEIKLDITIASTFHINLFCNNQSIDLTGNFEMSYLQNSYNEFVSAHENGLAIKGIANVLNLVGAVGGAISGNPTALLTGGKAITNIAGDIAEYIDLKNQPSKIATQMNIDNDLLFYNLIGKFVCEPSNIIEIQKNAKYYGDKVDFLTSLSLYYKTNTYTEYSTTYTVNFDYFQFANLELIANLPENTKTTIENMFLQGIRVWYNPTKFLQTIERKEIQA